MVVGWQWKLGLEVESSNPAFCRIVGCKMLELMIVRSSQQSRSLRFFEAGKQLV